MTLEEYNALDLPIGTLIHQANPEILRRTMGSGTHLDAPPGLYCVWGRDHAPVKGSFIVSIRSDMDGPYIIRECASDFWRDGIYYIVLTRIENPVTPPPPENPA